MTRTTLLLTPLLVLGLVCVAMADGPIAAEEAPKIPGVTRVEPGTKIKDIKSDPFTMKKAVVEGGVLKIDVSYAGGAKDHEFTLYWNGIVARSYPGKTSVHLKHNANGDMAEALITKTLEFDFAEMTKPLIITVLTDHGDPIRVEYGEAKRP